MHGVREQRESGGGRPVRRDEMMVGCRKAVAQGYRRMDGLGDFSIHDRQLGCRAGGGSRGEAQVCGLGAREDGGSS